MRLLALMLAFCVVSTHAQKDKKKPKPKKEWWDAGQPKFAQSDLGRVFCQSVQGRDSQRPSVPKAVSIRLGDAQEVTAVFDSELMVMAMAVPDRFVMFNTYRNGLGGSGNWLGPPYLLRNPGLPGWSQTGEFVDNREKYRNKPKGALPNVKWEGFYRYGERAVLRYRVGDTKVLDSPWAKGRVIARHLRVGPSDKPLEMLVSGLHVGDFEDSNGILAFRTEGGIAAARLLGKGKLVAVKDQIRLQLPASDAARSLTVLTWTGSELAEFANAEFANPDVSTWTQGGQALWTAPIVTKGKLGEDKAPFTVDTIEPPFDNPYKALFFFGGHDFFSNGDAAICTIHGDVWRVSGIDETLEAVSWKRFATGMFHPLGLEVVDDVVYVLGRDQITRLHDLNGDGEADYYENFNSDCEIGEHVHEYATNLNTDPDGNFYYIKGINGNQSRHAGTLIKVSPDGKKSEVFATGFRWPNGGGVGPDGTVTAADQQGTWVPSSRVDIVSKGGFYGHIPAHHREVEPTSYDGPLTWIPHSVDNSCGGQTWVEGNRWGGLDGHMIHLSYGKCKAFLVLQENIDGIDQGGVVEIKGRFSSGAMRACFRPQDGQRYVSGLKGWQTSAAKDGCFERMRYTGKPYCLPVGLNVHANGVKLVFNQELDAELVKDVESWNVERWNYRWTKAYGSKEFKVSNPEEKGHDAVPVQGVRLLPDGRSVFLELGTVGPVMQMMIGYDLETKDGAEVIGAVYNTIHAMRPAF